MDDARFVTIDSFPTCSKYARFLFYYMIKSTRVTIVAFGTRFILVYVKNKVTKRCILPEDVTCGTIIKVPGLKGDEKFLLCGTDCGSIFAIRLPSSKQDIIRLKDEADGSRTTMPQTRMSNSDYVAVYKYRNLEICAISCIDANILIVGPDETRKMQLIMFQPTVLLTALTTFKDGNQGENVDIANLYDEIPIQIPSMSEKNASQLKLMVMKAKETQSSPHHHSLDNILYIEQSVIAALFEVQEACVACFFLPNGEVWFWTLGYGSSSGTGVKFLTHLQEECVGATMVLLGETHDKSQNQSSDESAGHLTPALVLFGANHNLSILSTKREEKATNGQSFLPYTAELRALVRDWNGIIPIHQAFLRHRAKDFNVTSGIISFFDEQCLGIQQSDVLWSLQDYESHTSLLSINLSTILPNTHENEEISEIQIKDLIEELKMAEIQSSKANEKSLKITRIIQQMSALATYIIDNPISQDGVTGVSRRALELLNFVPSSLTVYCGNKKQVNLTVQVTNHENISILEPFTCQLQAVVRCVQLPQSRIHTFNLEDLKPGAVKHLCMLIDCADMLTNKVKVTVFLQLLKLGDAESDVLDILESGFPLIFEMYSVTMSCKI